MKTRTADQIVNQEILVCVSSLVSTLANASYAVTLGGPNGINASQLRECAEQAAELASPIPDYEEAAREAGFVIINGDAFLHPDGSIAASSPEDACGWQDLCHECEIEPYEREVFEHWAVTSWLADRLEEKGEKVDRDFAGLIVWARTTTGQGIASDSVMEAIAAELAREYPATLAERFQQGA